MAWRKLEDTFHSDRKVRKLARELAIPEPHAAGYVVTLWTWALLHAKDGDLSKFDVDDIEYGAKWDGSHGDFVHACGKVGLLDVGTDSISIHNWLERGGSYAESQRKRLKSKGNIVADSNVQDFPGNSRKFQERPGKSALEEKRREEKRIEENRSDQPLSKSTADAVDVDRATDSKIARDDINEVWQHYRTHHPSAAKVLKSNRKEYRLIRERLDDFSADELKRSIDGFHLSAFHCGDNQHGKRYLSLELMMRDISHVQAGLEYLAGNQKDNGRPRALDPSATLGDMTGEGTV